MMLDAITQQQKRRSTDLAPTSSNNLTIAKIKSDAAIGSRATDLYLAKRFTKADTPIVTTDIEMQFQANDLIISRTDTRGTITQCNDIFAKMSGWTQEELLGSNHNLIRHPDMPQIAFKLVWDTIKENKEFYGYVKNLRKGGGFYWVFAYITADFNDEGEIIGYTSYRRFAPKLAVDAMEPIYKVLLEAEERGGMKASESLLNLYLEKSGFSSYDQFIVDLQIKANASINKEL